MSKILEAFRNFQKGVHEMENAESLKHMSPQTTIYDIEHQFSSKRKFDFRVLSVFDMTLKKQAYVYHAALNHRAYTDTNPQNQVLMHGILFDALLNMYLIHFKKCFDNILLSDFRDNNTINKKVIIDFIEYNNLPKRYRGIFVQYDSDHYVLNVPYKNMVMTYNKKDKAKLKKLLLRAKMLIPVIYKTKKTVPDMDFGGMLQFYEHAMPESPAFVSDSADAKRVTDEQLKTIHELHDIFVEIAKITLPVETKVKTEACDVYYEYKREQEQKGAVLHTYNMSKDLKRVHQKGLANEAKAHKKKKQSMNESYKQSRIILLKTLLGTISVHKK